MDDSRWRLRMTVLLPSSAAPGGAKPPRSPSGSPESRSPAKAAEGRPHRRRPPRETAKKPSPRDSPPGRVPSEVAMGEGVIFSRAARLYLEKDPK